jgi:hypothetical protein
MNQCKNVIVVPYAFGLQSATVELYQNATNRGNLSLVDLADTGQSITVAMRRGEEVLTGLNMSPCLAKIDVEGYEPFVINGLGRYKPDTIMFEFYVPYLEAFGIDPETFLLSLTSEGYSLTCLDSDGTLQKKTPAELTAFSRQHRNTCNLLACR